MNIATASLSRQGTRASNQDQTGETIGERSACFVVCDGIAGLPGGEVAAELARNSIISRFDGDKHLNAQHIRDYVQTANRTILSEQQAVQDANIQSAIDRVIEARKKLDENTAFLDECRKNREDSKAKYMQVKALCGEFKAIYGQHCDTVRTMENVVRGSQSFLTNAIDSLTIVAKGYPFYAALMDSLLDGLPTAKKEE